MKKGEKMKRISILLVIVISMLLVGGCGNGDKNSISNTEGKTKLGYFGKDIYIGKHQGKKYWNIVIRKGINLELNILNEKNYVSMQDNKGTRIVSYGVSADGKTVTVSATKNGSPAMKIEILGSTGHNTYKASITSLTNTLTKGMIVELKTL